MAKRRKVSRAKAKKKSGKKAAKRAPKKSKKPAKRAVAKRKPAKAKPSRARAAKKTTPKKRPAQPAAMKKPAARPVAIEPMAVPAPYVPAPNETAVGKVTHYYSNLQVAVVHLDRGSLQVGDTIHIKGHTTDFEQRVDSMEIEHERIERAEPGDIFGLKVRDHAREHDVVYKVQ
jgi:putative protease